MNKTKKLTVSAVSVALGVIFLALGANVGALDMTAAALSSLIMVFIYIEVGYPYTYLAWLSTSVLSAVFFFASPVWLEYFLLFGIYPILKGYFERIPRRLWLVAKLAYANLSGFVIVILLEKLLGLPFISGELPFGLSEWVVYPVFIVVYNLALLVYDVFLNVMLRYYMRKLRHRFSRYLR